MTHHSGGQAFSNAEFRAVLVERIGAAPEEATPPRVGYELRKLYAVATTWREPPCLLRKTSVYELS